MNTESFLWSKRNSLTVTYYCLTHEGYRTKHSVYEFSTERNATASQKQWEASHIADSAI